jgi:thiamine-monophosphate kinase
MNEFELIHRLRELLPLNATTRVGAGDDCAVLDLGLPGRLLLFKTDAVVEGVHFEADAEPGQIGHKALARCLSDIAAMGGTPSHAVVTLGVPASFDPARIEGVYGGLRSLAERHGVAIVGGETTSNPERLLLSVAVIGTVREGHCPLRSGAQAGDAVFVTGELGGAFESGRHMTIEPRLEEARWLVDHFHVHAMIDLSDGLAGDLRHILNASRVGAEVLVEAIPVHPGVSERQSAPAESGVGPHPQPAGWQRALSDGEDYELLFTVAESDAAGLSEAWRQRFPGLRLSRIGTITAGSAFFLREGAKVRPFTLHGYEHF